jgi:multidrug efflux system membrane fusion protein
MKPNLNRSWALLPLLLLAALALGACSKTEPAPEPVRSVRTMLLGSEIAGGTREFAADVRARVESRLGMRVAGRLISRAVEIGQHVKAGQTLAQLDSADLQLGKDAAAAAARAAQTNYELAAAEFKRYKELREQGFIGALDLERREATLKAQKAVSDQAQAQVQVQSNQASYGALLAPAAGVVTAIEAEPGTVLAAGTPVVRLAHDGPRDVVFSVPEDQLAQLRALQGKAGALRVKPWSGSETLPATVREIAAAADATTRTFLVKADIGAASLQLGQTVTVEIELPRVSGVAKLPLTAVTRQHGQTAVWVVDRGSMTVKAQAIAVAGADGNSVVVTGGLSPGQIVVTAGVHALTPGQKVKFYEVTAADTPAATPAARPASAASR